MVKKGIYYIWVTFDHFEMRSVFEVCSCLKFNRQSSSKSLAHILYVKQWFSMLKTRRPTKDKYKHFGGPPHHKLSELCFAIFMHFMELKIALFCRFLLLLHPIRLSFYKTYNYFV